MTLKVLDRSLALPRRPNQNKTIMAITEPETARLDHDHDHPRSLRSRSRLRIPYIRPAYRINPRGLMDESGLGLGYRTQFVQRGDRLQPANCVQNN